MSQIYRNIAYEIESDLRQMRLNGNSRLPSEDSLCAIYSCSRHTVRAALDLLVAKGLIVKKRGSGSYISDKVEKTGSDVIMIIEDEDEYIYPELISDLCGVLKKKGFDLKCISTKGSYGLEKDALNDVLSSSPAAVIMEPISNMIPDRNIPLIEDIKAKGIPVIYLFTSYPSSRAVCIREDNEGGAKRLVSYLKENGHTNICGIFRCDDSRGIERYKGYTDALYEFGLPFDQKQVFFFTGSDRKRLMEGDDAFLTYAVSKMDKDITSVICHNDEIAFRLLKVLRKSGRGSITAVSFDNSYYASSSASFSSLGHSSREFISSAEEAVLSAVQKRPANISPLKWHLHIRNG